MTPSRLPLALLTLALLVALIGCGDDTFDPGRAEGTTTVDAPPGMVLRLEPVGPRGVRGTASLEPAGDRGTQVRLVLSAPPEGRVSADIHRGTCAEVEDFNAAYPLGNTDARELVSEAPVTLDSLRTAPHAIDVHPMGEPIDMLACANIPQRGE